MSAALRNGLASALLAAALGLMPVSVLAQQDDTVSGDKTTDMVVDALVMRPLGLAATVVGTVLTVVALPFTIPSGSVETSARQLILRPADYTFKRPLGDFSDSGEDASTKACNKASPVITPVAWPATIAAPEADTCAGGSDQNHSAIPSSPARRAGTSAAARTWAAG